MSSSFKPMLAAKAKPEKLKFPLLVQAKVDGIRCSVVGGRALSRTLKEIPNREVYEYLSRPEFEGLDGELVVGDVTADDAYRTTVSFIMAPDKTGEPWVFHVFDKWDEPGSYASRHLAAQNTVIASGVAEIGPIQMLGFHAVLTESALQAAEEVFVNQGLEGVILRAPDKPYKFGRGSVTAGDLLKLKRFEDSEAVILGVYEELHNGNEAVTNALGRTERSSVKANKVGKGTAGGFHVHDCVTGVEFRVGTGLDAAQRQDFWERRDELLGMTIKYRYFAVGVKDKPRHPVYAGFRDLDIDG